MAIINGKNIALSPRLTVVNNTFVNKLKFIGKSTLSADAAGFSFDADIDGKAFSLQSLYLAFNIVPDWESTSNRVLSLRAYTNIQPTYVRYLCHKQIDFGDTGYGLIGILKSEFLGGITTSEVRSHKYKEGVKLAGTANEHAICAVSNSVNEPITDLTLYFYDTTAKKRVTLKAGSTIELWGCDYENLS